MTMGILIGTITEGEQLHVLGLLFKLGCIFLPLAVVLVSCMREYRTWRNWKAWLRLIAILVLYAGAWSWFGYFGNHGGFFIWPVVVLVAFCGLIIWYRLVVAERQRKYAEWLRNDFPEPPNINAGPANRSDFEDWK